MERGVRQLAYDYINCHCVLYYIHVLCMYYGEVE